VSAGRAAGADAAIPGGSIDDLLRPTAEAAPQPAGFARRCVAVLVDAVVLLGLLLAWALVIALAFDIAKPGWETPYFIGCAVLPWLYYALVEAGFGAASLGKRSAGLRVVDTEGLPPGFGRALLRVLVRALSVASLGLGFLLAALPPRHRALHDLLSGTVVVARDGRQGA
jgi:uncharacterized RDD family membrane protein YckC